MRKDLRWSWEDQEGGLFGIIGNVSDIGPKQGLPRFRLLDWKIVDIPIPKGAGKRSKKWHAVHPDGRVVSPYRPSNGR